MSKYNNHSLYSFVDVPEPALSLEERYLFFNDVEEPFELTNEYLKQSEPDDENYVKYLLGGDCK